MNEAQKILRKEMDTTQWCIDNLQMDIKLKQESLKRHKEKLKEILEGLMVLEGEKPTDYESKQIGYTGDEKG